MANCTGISKSISDQPVRRKKKPANVRQLSEFDTGQTVYLREEGLFFKIPIGISGMAPRRPKSTCEEFHNSINFLTI